MHKRVLLKLSGEALGSEAGGIIDAQHLERFAKEIQAAHAAGVQIALVVGGGNIFRGRMASELRIPKETGDHMGMLATAINALALQSMLENLGVPTRVLSAIEMHRIAEPYIQRRAIRHLEKGRIVVFAAGTGNPHFTTDTAAILRGTEIGAELVLKATNVEGVYSADPRKDPAAILYDHLSFTEAIERRLAVMDATALALSRDNRLPIRVFTIETPGNITHALLGDAVLGTLVQ